MEKDFKKMQRDSNIMIGAMIFVIIVAAAMIILILADFATN